MSDRDDTKQNSTPQDGADFSVEEILTEFSTARNNSRRVVQFPTPPRREEPEEDEEEEEDEPSPPPVKKKPGQKQTQPPRKRAEIINMPPSDDLAFEVTQRLKGLMKRAEDYADQMYQQTELTPEEKRAERYIPGVDLEDEFDEPPAQVKKPKPAAKLPKDIHPAELAGKYGKGLTAMRVRLVFALLLTVLCAVLAAQLPVLSTLTLPAEVPFTLYQLRLLGSVVLLALTALLCGDVVWAGLIDLFTAKPGVETLAALAALLTLADGLTMPEFGTRGDTLPCAAPACAVLVCALWGRRAKRRGDRLACRTAAQTRHPYVVTMDDAKWSGRPAYCKWSGTLRRFGSQIQMPDGVQKVYRIAAPLLLLTCILCSLLASAGRGSPQQFLWACSSMLTAASTCTALLAYGLPYQGLVRRLSRAGAALAGWPGVERCGEGSVVLTDTDLFPPGSVKLNGIKIFGDHPNERVVAYTSTLIRSSGSGLEKPFSDLMKAQNALYRTASGVRFHEGGITGIIRNQEVMVGTAAFMRLMNVALPQGLNVKNAVFCAIDGDLAGIFALHYAMQNAVSPCLSTMIRNRIAPLLATRDPNLLPSLLGQKFKLPVDKMEFPAIDRRLELSDENQDHDDTPAAMLCREGLSPYCDAAVGAKRLRTAVRLGAAFSVAGSCVGVLLTFYLTFVDAYWSLSPLALLAFLLCWLVPVLFLTDWANRY